MEAFIGNYSIEELAKGDDAVVEAVNNYKAAKARMEGIQEKFQQTREQQYEESDRSIQANDNNGMVYATQLKDEPVYITGGNVVLNEDGTIDVDNSSETLYVKFPDGHVKMTSPGKFTEVFTSDRTADLKAAKRAEIDAKWKVEFDAAEVQSVEQEKREAGVVFDKADAQGNHRIEILNEGEEMSDILLDGAQMEIPTEELNRWKQEAGVQAENVTQTTETTEVVGDQVTEGGVPGQSGVYADNQGNPVDADGKLVLDEVNSIDEISDEDFETPTRNVQLPAIPENVANAIGTNGRPVVIKKNVFEKNGNTHVELEPEDSRNILRSALYNPNLVGSTQPIRRPDYKVAIRTGEQNAVVVLDVYQEKDFVEIVGWRMVNEKGLAKMQRQAEREGGQFLILSPNDGSAAALSALPLGLSSESEGTAQDVNLQENAQKSGENNQPDVPDFFRLNGTNYEVASRNDDGSVDVMVNGKRETLPAGTDYSTYMPTDKKGEVQYEQMPVERTHEYFVQRVKDDEARAEMIEKRRKKAEAERKKFDKNPDPGIDPDAYEAKMTQWEADKKAAQAKVDYWNEIAKRDAEITRSETREAVENIKPDVMKETADEFIANQLAGIKITPESFKRETGLSNAEQAQLVGVISNDGVSVERAAEIILENYDSKLKALGFTGDVQDVRDIIIDVLSQGNPRSYAKRGREAREAENMDQQRADAEVWAKGAFDMTLDELYLYEETILPRMIRDYEGFDENEYYSNLAENNGYDTTRESESIGRGGKVLQGEQSVPAAGTPTVGERSEGGAVSDDVQGGGQNGVAQGETGQVNNETLSQGTDQVGDQVTVPEGDAPGQSGVLLSDEVDENGRQFVLNSKGEIAFGEILEDSGLTPAPILLSEGLITNPATNDGYGLVHIEARHGDQIRNAGYNSVVEFVEEVAKNYEVIREGKDRNGQQTYMLQLTDKHNNTLMVELSGDGTYWNINTAGIFKTSYGKNRKEVYNRHTTAKQPTETVEASQDAEQSGTQAASSMNAPTTSSASEDRNSVSNSQENVQESGEIAENGGEIQEIAFLETLLDNGDKKITGMNSRGEVATVTIERDGKVVSVDSYDEGVLFEHTEYDGNGKASSVTRYDKSGNVVGAQKYVNGIESRAYVKETMRTAPLRKRAEKWMKDTGVPVRLIGIGDEITNRAARRAINAGEKVTGWIDNNEVVLYLPNISNEKEIDDTFVHEVVAHKGLKALMGEDFDALCDKVWEMMSEEQRAHYINYPGVNGDTRKAADEYMAHLAEGVDLTEQDKTVWQRIVEAVREFLVNHGMKMTDGDIENLIRASYANLKEQRGESKENAKLTKAEKYKKMREDLEGLGVFGEVALPKGYKWSDGKKYGNKGETVTALVIGDDLYLRDNQKIGGIVPFVNLNNKNHQTAVIRNFRRWPSIGDFKTALFDVGYLFDRATDDAINEIFTQNGVGFNRSILRPMFRIAEVNDKFNSELESLNEENADKVVLNVGNPSPILLSAGVEDRPMKLYGNKIIKKAKKHGFKIQDLKNLPSAVADPIAVFDNYQQEGNRSILTELRTADGNILATVDLGKGMDIDFNIISSAFGKSDNKIVSWINKGFATYINKEKALDYLHLSAPIAEASDKQELSSAAKIVESFENPNIESENSSENPQDAESGIRFRKVEGRDRHDWDGNLIGDGSWHVPYEINDIALSYPNITYKVHESASTESVYVTYYNNDPKYSESERPKVTVRFSNHTSNAVAYGDQLVGVVGVSETAKKYSTNLLLVKLGLKKEVPVRRKLIDSRAVSNKVLNSDVYEEADKTIQELYNLPVGADISQYKGKLAKGSRYLILGDKVKEGEIVGHEFEDIPEVEKLRAKQMVRELIVPFAKELREEKVRLNNAIDTAVGFILGSKELAKKRRLKREAARKQLAKEMYSSVLKGDFNDVTLSQIDKFIEDATPANPFGRRISQRLPQRMERGLRQGARTNAVDALFSRICESTVPANERFSEAGRREIEERKKELLKGWAIATGNWHTDLKEFTDDTEPIGEGKDSKVYMSKDGNSVIKASKGKPFGKKFRPDIDNIPLFNDVFKNSRYEILGYGEIDGQFVRILKQDFIDFAESTPLTPEERKEYMGKLGFKPLNKDYTAFSNGEIVIADLQKSNIVKDAAGNISVIDADAKLHTKDVGGDYTYPPVEEDLPEDSGTRFRIANENQEIFVSNAQRAVEGIQQNKATAEQWIAMLKKNGGLKAGEDAWMGLEEWLNEKQGAVTKQEILDYIGANKIQIEEVNYVNASEMEDLRIPLEKSHGKEFADKFFKAFDIEYGEFGIYDEQEAVDLYNEANGADIQLDKEGYWDDFDDREDILNWASRVMQDARGDAREIYHTRLDYTTDGLNNKREIALVVPTVESYNIGDYTHFGDAGNGRAVAWVRFGETTADTEETIAAKKAVNDYLAEMREKYNTLEGEETDAMTAEEIERLQELTAKEIESGEKKARVLVIDEIQSKRHQEGREKGYRGVGLAKEVLNAEEEVRKTNRELTAYREPLKEKYNFKELGGSMSERLKNFDAMLSEEERITMDALGQARNEAEKRLQELREQERGIPSAPFEKNWHELAMKRMLRLAAEEGFDKVAWTTGEQQAERYNMSRGVDFIQSEDNNTEMFNDGTSVAKDVHILTTVGSTINLKIGNDGVIHGGEFDGKNLAELVGKELAVKLMQPGNIELEGEGLKIGGEGMKGFYDRMLPSFVSKYTKKWGAKVGEVTMPNLRENNTMHSVDVTPEMQESVMQGQTMFRMGSRVDARMAEVAAHFDGKQLTAEQRAVVDVFGGKADNLTVSAKTQDGNERKVVMRQGNEMGAGAKHSLYRHYGMNNGAITAEDILFIPEILANGETAKNGKKTVYRYSTDGVEYTVITENNKGREEFANFYTNRKASSAARKTRSEEARDTADDASEDKGSDNSSNTQEGETRFSTRGEGIDNVPTQPLTLMERITNSLLEVSAKNKENLGLRASALRTFGRDINRVLSLMKAQREYDKSTVDTLVKLAKMYFQNAQLLGEVTPYEVARIMGVLNRMARMFTSQNPAFIVTNLSRDIIWAGTVVATKENPEYVKMYTKNITKALAKGQLPILIHKFQKGTLDADNELERYFIEFMENGGETGFTQINTVEDYKRNIKRFMKEAKDGVNITTKAWRGVWGGVEFLNRSAEDTTRFMVYMTSRQMGRTVAQSIWDAKEVTVNFNKKGSGEMGAKYLNFAYIFFNATMQALSNFGKLIVKHPGRTTAALSIYSALGFFMPMINAAIVAMFGGDEEDYWDLPEWVRRNNIVMFAPWTEKGFITILLPHELRPFYGMGEAAYSALAGKEDVEDAIYGAMNGFTGLLPLDYTGNGGNALVNITPTIFQPYAQVKANVDYFGKPIYRDNPFNENAPEWTKAYKGTNRWLVGAAEWLNMVTGGNEVKRGLINLNPAVVEHLIEGYTGGLGKTVNKTWKTISMLWDEDVREARNIPVISSFYQEADERSSGSRLNREYFEALEELKDAQFIYSGYRKRAESGSKEYQELLEEFVNSKEFRRLQIIKNSSGIIKQLDDILKDRPLTEEQEKAIKDEITYLKTQMLNTLEDLEEEEPVEDVKKAS